jgi:uncharacterized lipoprotein NlpE involved in copper resistance
MFAQRNHLTVCEGAGTPISKILNRHHGSYRAAERHGLRGYSKPFVKRATFIGLYMGKANITKLFNG